MTSAFQDAGVAAAWQSGAREREAAMAGTTDALFSLARIEPGMRVLDCGCGSGEMASRLAQAVAPGGSVLAVDSSEEMLSLARQATAGAPNVGFRQADLQRLGLDGNRFQAALSRNVVMLVADPAAAVRSVRAALAPGARFACSVWTENGNPRFELPLEILRGWGVEIPHDSPLLLVRRLGREDLLGGLLAEAGFSDVQCVRMAADRRFAGFDQLLLDEARSPIVTGYRASAGEEAANRLLEALAERYQRFRRGAGAVLPGLQLVAAGTA
jgi:SAM-dependent methyltransferase